jgi:hypothetical protein
MSRQASPFLNLPLELRISIYSHALIDHQPEIPCVVKGSTVVLRGTESVSAYTQRPKAFRVENCSSDVDGPALVCPLALSQVNRQIRSEFSDYLRTAPVDIVSRIRNFNWSHLMCFIRSLPDWRKDQFLVGKDGMADSTLYFELGGPYSPDWRTNLMCWIEFVEDWTQSPSHELKTLHKTIQDLSTSDRWCRAPPGEIVCEVYTMYQCQRKRIGRLEMDKVFYTLLGRYKAEVMLRGGPPTSVSDVFLAQTRGILWP